MITQADASGGLGSFLPDLRSILTDGLRTLGNAEILKRYGPGVFTDLPVVAADGTVRHAGAPTPPPAPADQLGDTLRRWLSNPFVLVGVAILGAVVIARFVRS